MEWGGVCCELWGIYVYGVSLSLACLKNMLHVNGMECRCWV